MLSITEQHNLLLESFERNSSYRIRGFEDEGNAPEEVRGACKSILNTYERWEPPKPNREDKIETYVPSLLQLAGNPYKDTYKTLENWKREILHLSLFVDKLWIPDPSEFIACDIISYSYRNDEPAAKKVVHYDLFNTQNAIAILQAIRDLMPLVEAGILEFYPAIHAFNTRIAEQLFQEKRGFTKEELIGAWPDLFVAEGLLFADYFNASYVAMHRDELEVIDQKLKELSLHQPENISITDAKLISALPKLQLPFFENLDAGLLAEVRLNEESFEDFRQLLRGFSRQLGGGLEKTGFNKEIQQLEKEVIEPEIDNLLKQINAIGSLRSSLSENGIDFGIAAIAGVVGSLMGDPFSIAVTTAGVSALSKALITTIMKQKEIRPAAQVAYSFHSGRVPQPKTNHWKVSAFNNWNKTRSLIEVIEGE